jgi:hypothetical protein
MKILNPKVSTKIRTKQQKKRHMNLEDFLKFVDKTIGELIFYGQLHSGNDYSDYEIEFKWEIDNAKIVKGRVNIIYEITDKVFISPEKIYPCVDLIIEQPTQEKKLRILGRRAGYEPREFGTGWSNRPGPFIYGIGKGIITGQVKTDTLEFKKKLVEFRLLHYKLE